MPQRRAALLQALRLGPVFSTRFGWLRAELLLSFGLEFPLQLFDARGQFLNLLVLGRVLPTQGVNLPLQGVRPLRLLVGRIHQRAQRRAAQVWATLHVRTTEFVLGVENEVHRRPLLGKRCRCRESTHLLGRAQ